MGQELENTPEEQTAGHILEGYRTQDREFAFMVGALGYSVNKARSEAGLSNDQAYSNLMRDPKVLAYIEELRAENERNLNITRNDVQRGLLRAISDGRTLSDPRAQIAGWSEINKMNGYHAPQKSELDVHLTAKVELTQKQIRNMPDEELLRLAAEDDAIEGEFEELPDESE